VTDKKKGVMIAQHTETDGTITRVFRHDLPATLPVNRIIGNAEYSGYFIAPDGQASKLYKNSNVYELLTRLMDEVNKRRYLKEN
jgi:hypothetical protein